MKVSLVRTFKLEKAGRCTCGNRLMWQRWVVTAKRDSWLWAILEARWPERFVSWMPLNLPKTACTILQKIKTAIKNCLRGLSESFILLPYNIRTHVTAVCSNFDRKSCNSAELSPCDYHVFRVFKKVLKESWFVNIIMFGVSLKKGSTPIHTFISQ